jgi:anti-sigma regulatory factor (Ser/Thr protein kinase)
MTQKRLKLVIDSDLEQVSLIGITINKLCSLTPLSESEFNQIELCVVEAVNNSVEHAYGNEKGHDVEVTFTLHADRLVVDVCDTGKPMEKGLVEQRDISLLEIDPDDLDNIAEEGRGIPIMKKIMDTVTYGTEDRKNCLTLTKNL